MIEFLAAVLGGIAANQTDDALKTFDRGWELIARYVIGVLTIEVFFAMMIRRLRPDATVPALLSFNGAAAGVGIGVIAARIWKDLTGSKA